MHPASRIKTCSRAVYEMLACSSPSIRIPANSRGALVSRRVAVSYCSVCRRSVRHRSQGVRAAIRPRAPALLAIRRRAEVLPGAGRPASHPVSRHAFPPLTQSWTCASSSSSASNSISSASNSNALPSSAQARSTAAKNQHQSNYTIDRSDIGIHDMISISCLQRPPAQACGKKAIRSVFISVPLWRPLLCFLGIFLRGRRRAKRRIQNLHDLKGRSFGERVVDRL